jgi:hypothetical protein
MMNPSDMKWVAAASLGLALICALKPGAARAEQRIVCPMMVESRHISVDAPDGWTGIYGHGGTLPLRGAEAIFVYGSLREPWGQLKDPPTVKKGKAIITRYPLPPEPDKWLICDYGDLIYQAMKLPTATKECSVTANREYVDSSTGKPVYRVSDITCK